MWFSSLLRNLRSKSLGKRRHASSTTRRRPSVRPQVEALEARDLPSFASPVAYGVPNGPQALVTADVNGDGKPDLISLVDNGQDVAVQLNNGKGSFGPAVDYVATGDPAIDVMTALAVGNVNGKPEIVAAGWGNFGQVNPPPHGLISVLQGDGNGGFMLAGTWDGRILSWDAAAGAIVWEVEVGAPCHWQPVMAGGWVYAGLEDGSVVAFDTRDPACDGWPMWGGGAGHNG